jgi:uncharacterized protein (TIGR03086 family)
MDASQQLSELMPVLMKVVDQIGPEDLARPTPCATFDVAGVLEHMIGGATAFAPAFRGAAPGAPFEGDVVTRWRAAMDELVAAVGSGGALERTLATPFGELSGAAFGQYVVFDGLVHGWDLTTALGLPYDPPAAVVDQVHAALPALVPDPARDGDTFAAAVPAAAGASPLEQVVAFSGRAS